MSLTKSPNPKPKKYFSLQFHRLAESSEHLHSSLMFSVHSVMPTQRHVQTAGF